MKILPVVSILLAALASTGLCIQCYICNGKEKSCKKEDIKDKTTDCPNVMDQCFRSWANEDGCKTVSSGCANDKTCEMYKETCEKEKENNDDMKCSVSCCKDDLCNAAAMLSCNTAVIIIGSLLGIIAALK